MITEKHEVERVDIFTIHRELILPRALKCPSFAKATSIQNNYAVIVVEQQVYMN